MGIGLIWIAALLTSLSLAAAAAAHAARLQNRLLREATAGLLFSVPAVACAAVGAAFYLLFDEKYLPAWPFAFFLSLFVLHLACGGWILRKGLKAGAGEPVGRNWNRGLLTLLFAVALLFFFTSYTTADLERKTSLAHVNAEIRARAHSIYPAPVPRARNAAEIYQKAYDSLIGNGPVPSWLGYAQQPEHHVMGPEVLRFLNQNRAVVQLVRRAAAMPEFHLPFDASRLVGSSAPKIDIYWPLARVMALDAAAKAAQGDPARAMENLFVIRTMVEHLLSVPGIMPFYAASRVAKIGLEGLEPVLARGVAGFPALPVPLAANPTRRPDFGEALRLEELFDLEVNVLMAPGAEQGEDSYTSFDLYLPLSYPPYARSLWRVFAQPEELACVRKTWGRLHEMAAKPYYRNREDLAALEKSFETDPKGHIIENIVRYRADYINGECAVLDARERLADLAMAAAAFIKDKGVYPLRMSDLVPGYLQETPLDPFDGKPMKMMPVTGGIALSSRGSGDRDDAAIHVYIGKRLYEEKRVAPARLELEKKNNPVKGKKKRPSIRK